MGEMQEMNERMERNEQVIKDIKKNDPENPSPATYNSDII